MKTNNRLPRPTSTLSFCVLQPPASRGAVKLGAMLPLTCFLVSKQDSPSLLTRSQMFLLCISQESPQPKANPAAPSFTKAASSQKILDTHMPALMFEFAPRSSDSAVVSISWLKNKTKQTNKNSVKGSHRTQGMPGHPDEAAAHTASSVCLVTLG